MTINHASFNRYQIELLNTKLLIQSQSAFGTIRIGSRRLIGTGGDVNGYDHSHCDLHRDGSGSWAQRVAPQTSTVNGEDFLWTEPDTVVWLLMSALNVLGLHARDRAGATGTALVKAALVESPHRHPSGPPRPPILPLLPVRVDSMRADGMARRQLSTRFCA